ncbi:hypothetical protein BN946_scf184992.g22 [Trametes cinnabarina]|uniref:Uncharacterized protein n=1 Tax=Pycnoporus cinnabarinus TaxID=5643 RepID=A0A060S9K4_PYCCI|nr:hypothetical protein BN946_scf184992.g22 [Trametes cinnabarina]
MAGSLFQHSYYIVNNLNAILYGVVLVLYFGILRIMYNSRKRTSTDLFMVVFSTVLVLLNTIFWTTQTYFGEMMWITHADYPGGSDQYWVDFGSVWYQIWGMAACVVCNLMSDALLTYRCYVIWNSRRVVILPCMLWIASLAFAIGLLYESGRPHGNYFVGIATVFVTAYTASTFAFNVIVTGLIVGRILAVGRRLGYSQDYRVYTGAVALMVESALPFTVFSAAYLVTYAMGSDISMAFSFYAMFTCISPLLIALRVLSRRAWTRESCTLFTTTISCAAHADFLTTGAVSEDGAQKKIWDLEAAGRGGAVDAAVHTLDITPSRGAESQT